MGPNPEILIPLLAILAIFVIMPGIIVAGIVASRKLKQTAGLADSSVGLGELEERMERAVEKSIAPLRRQISALEARLEERESRSEGELKAIVSDKQLEIPDEQAWEGAERISREEKSARQSVRRRTS